MISTLVDQHIRAFVVGKRVVNAPRHRNAPDFTACVEDVVEDYTGSSWYQAALFKNFVTNMKRPRGVLTQTRNQLAKSIEKAHYTAYMAQAHAKTLETKMKKSTCSNTTGAWASSSSNSWR